MAKKEQKRMVRCYDCSVGSLIQWDNNPVIVICRNLGTKDVAKVPRQCNFYRENKDIPKVTRMKHIK